MKNSLFTLVLFAIVLYPIKSIGQDLPNIIVIIPDDLGWSDIGYNGSAIQTPNIDRLEAESLRFNFQYVMTTCTPTRIGFFTGKYASRMGVTGPDYGELIPRDMPTMATLLKEQGYYTALVGKWHMGNPPENIPINYGFDSAYGYFAGQIDPYTHEYKEESENSKRITWNGEGDYLRNLEDNSKSVSDKNQENYGFRYLEEEGHITDLLTDEAIRIIKRNDRDRPFFLYLGFSAPHFPLNEPDEWTSLYKDTFAYSSRRRFAASVTHMDDAIGKIIEVLKKTGQEENTVILFISDNGGQKSWSQKSRSIEYEGRYADISHEVLGNNFPLRGWKNTLYEGGIRVPAFLSFPKRFNSGVLDTPVKWTDWLPTFLKLIGVGDREIKRNHFDGDDLIPLFDDFGLKNQYDKRTIFWESPKNYAIRIGKWKLIEEKSSGDMELYNIEEDFREDKDVSKKYPDKVKDLLKVMKEL